MTTTAVTEFDALHAEVTKLVEPVFAVTVIDADSAGRAQDALSEIKRLGNTVEAVRKELKQPYLDKSREIDGRAAAVAEPLAKAEKHLKQQCGSYEMRRRQEAEAEQRRLEAERRAIQEKIEADRKIAEEAAQAYGGEVEHEEFDVAQKAIDQEIGREKAQVADAGKVSGVRLVWKVEVTDFNLIPDAFVLKEANMTMLLAMARGQKAAPNVPGVRFWQEPEMAVRAPRQSYTPQRTLR